MPRNALLCRLLQGERQSCDVWPEYVLLCLASARLLELVACVQDFSGADARKHTTCISEAEKYEKTLYRGPKKGGKVDPQELWTAQVAKAAAGATRHRELLERLTAYSNAPRKLPKFVNFARNSIGVRDERSELEQCHTRSARGTLRPK